MTTPLVLLNPGPVNVSDAVRAALGNGDLCHREPEFSALLASVAAKLLQAFSAGDTHEAVFVTGSGTAAVEAAVISLVRADRAIAVVDNGVYGARIAAMARAHSIETRVIRSGWSERPPEEEVARVLDDPNVDALALVHHETTTGLLNPVSALARLARERGKLLLLDTVSGLGGEELDLSLVDAAVCTANKCLGGLPGVSFVLSSRAAALRMEEAPTRSLYLDLKGYARGQRSGSPPFTPAIQIFWALEAALDELLRETLSARIARFRAVSEFLRRRFVETGLELYLPPELRSNTITTVRLPRGWTYPELHDALKREGFVIYAGQGKLEREIFRVANMGAVSMSEYQRFANRLASLIG